jgi:protocatechuate 3,4-dioxygenase beta subunit
MLTALVLGALGLTSLVLQPGGEPRTSSIAIAPAGEPGDAMSVEGRILMKDGTPARGLRVYVYQTDARGYYSAGAQDERNPGERNPRLKGYLTTDDEGRYAFRTIKPGQYPGSGPPAHIHYEVTNASGAVERFELVFEGDSRLTDAIRRDAAAHGEYALCQPQSDAAGVTHCRGADFFLKGAGS